MVWCSEFRGASAYRGHGVEARERRGLRVQGSKVSAGDRDMRAIGAALRAILMLLAFALASPAAAQEEPTGTSYITPFPEGDVYKLQAYGDPFAEGLLGGLARVLRRRHPRCRSRASIARWPASPAPSSTTR